MASIAFRLTKNTDPEELLEEAALWKAMHDEYGDDIVVIEGDGDPSIPTFGRGLRSLDAARNPIPGRLDYWKDPVFLRHARRSLAVCSFEEAKDAVSALHRSGKGAFVKSTRAKHAIFRMPVGADFYDAMGAMAYSFIDGGPDLMVQELCQMEFEHRFFCIDREIVTDSPVQWSLTPLDYPLPFGTVFTTPSSTEPVYAAETVSALRALAEEVATEMDYPHAGIDCAMIDGEPGVVEFNPMQLGQLGLYASDVRALAKASRKLVHDHKLQREECPLPVMSLP